MGMAGAGRIPEDQASADARVGAAFGSTGRRVEPLYFPLLSMSG